MSKKPASRPIAKALPTKRGTYHAQFALPGLIPELFQDRTGRKVEFESEKEAEQAAKSAVFGLLETRTYDTRKAGPYARLKPANLGVLLRDADVSPTEFARIYGVPQSRVIKWLEGEQDIPHSANLIAHAIQEKDFLIQARAFTADWEREDPQQWLERKIRDDRRDAEE